MGNYNYYKQEMFDIIESLFPDATDEQLNEVKDHLDDLFYRCCDDAYEEALDDLNGRIDDAYNNGLYEGSQTANETNGFPAENLQDQERLELLREVFKTYTRDQLYECFPNLKPKPYKR